ncbi:class E sortase [Goekera deserti]|uniref:class E sortase n=1 Tax=Goekera deserti TaxID=2497753 RepID=UPI001F32AD11|nr:class E sortase [Goekera deserti]
MSTPTTGSPAGQDRDRRPGDLWRTVARGVGQTLVTAGLVVLLFVVYELYVTDLFADRRQDAVADELRATWDGAPEDPTVAAAPAAPPAQVPLGQGVGFLHVPRLGPDWSRAVVEGTGPEQLEQGPGHYVGTAMPGQPGNVGIAGHRVGTGSPFLDLDRLRPGDPVVLETADAWFVYRVLGDPATGDLLADPSGIPGQQVVSPTDVDVISPTPDADPAAPATGSYLTLTTCHPKYSARQRLVVHARLDGAPVAKADAPGGPPALTGD